MDELKNEILTNEMQTKLSQVMSPQMKLDGAIKEHIATRRPVENCVRVYDNVIDSEWCNDVIERFEKSKPESFNTTHKEYTELDIDNLPEERSEMGLPYHPFKLIRDKFVSIMEENLTNFKIDVGIKDLHLPPVMDMENIRIKKYTDNGKDQFGEHVDVLRSMGPSAKRFLVFILYLSDVEEGGETSIPRYDIKVKPKQGRLLMFPPFWTHPHQGEKVTKGTKYTIMSYLHYGDRDDNNTRKRT